MESGRQKVCLCCYAGAPSTQMHGSIDEVPNTMMVTGTSYHHIWVPDALAIEVSGLNTIPNSLGARYLDPLGT